MSKKIDDALYEQGLAAYHSGTSLRQMLDLTNAVETALGEAADNLPEGSEERRVAYHRASDAQESIMLGFADGVLADLRNVLTSPTFQRTGTRA